MTLKTSLIISGDSKTGVAAVDALRKSVEQAGASAAKAAPQNQQLDKAQDAVALSAKAASAAQGALDTQFRAAAVSAGALGGALTSTQADLASMSGQVRGTEQDFMSLRGAIGAIVADMGGLSTATRAGIDQLRASLDGLNNVGRATVPMSQAMSGGLNAVATEARSAGFQLSDLSEKSAAQIRRQTEAANSAGHLTGNLGLQRAGWQQLGFQVQDVGIQYSMNTRISQILAMQSGQLFGAISMIAQGSENATGKLGKFATVMAGPWGIAAGVAISLGTLLWSELSKVDDSSKDAASSTIDFSSSLVAQQGIVGSSIDGIKQLDEATRGLINTQAILLDNLQKVAKASVNKLEGQLAGVDRQIAAQSDTANSTLANLPGTFGLFGDGLAARGAIARLRKQRDDIQSDITIARGALTASTVSLEERTAKESADPSAKARGEIERERARLRERRQFSLDGDAQKNALAGGGKTFDYIGEAEFGSEMAKLTRRENEIGKKPPATKKDGSAAKAAREAERLATFGERAEDAIARLNDQFNAAPRDIDQARAATDKLDAVIADLQKRKPPNFEDLIAQAKAIKPLIIDSLQRPIREMLDDQQRQIALGTLQVQGRVAEADALKLTNALMDKMGVETEAQLATELAKRQISGDQVEALYGNLEVLREQTRELEKQQQAQQVFIGALGDMRENVRLTIESLRSDGPKALGDFAKRSLDVFDRLFSQVAVEKLFGGLFDDLEEQITGGDGTSKAGKKLAEAVDRAAKDMKKTSGDIVELGKAAAKASGMINGTSPAAATLPAGWIMGDDGKAFDPSNTDITVTAPEKNPLKELKSGFKEGFEGFFDEMKGDLKDVFTDIFGDRGVFPATLGKTLGRLTAGAQTGAMAGSIVTGILGIKGSSTGGAIGGAIGTAIAGPIGSIVGGALGSIAGGLLKKTQSGAANITNVDGKASLSGNNAGFQRAAVGAAEDVQDGLASIAEQLGGAIGGFNVTIGQRHGDWRVRSGAGSLKIAKGATEFDDDEAGAKAYAMQLAISQGAITGLSAAVSKALKSSDDLETALTEALKVQEIELLIGGIGAQIASQFKTLETQAKERLRIASEYGFDVVAIEKKNAEDRVALSERLLEEQVGSLQRLVDEMTSGSLFEGSAIEQRNAILKEIDQAKVDLAAGKDGAGDKLATLLQNLNTVSEDAFGSTAQYAADRAMIQDEARAAIAAANAQIREAANKTASDPALTTTNQALDENNDQNAQIISLLQTMIDRGQIIATSGTLDAASLARTS